MWHRSRAEPEPEPRPAVVDDDPVARARRLLRIHSVFNLLALATWLAGAAVTATVTWMAGYEDWYLYGTMGLCTAIVVSGYGRLRPRTAWVLRLPSWLFAQAVVLAWTALLFEKTQASWAMTETGMDDQALPMLWISVALNLMCAALMTFHILFVAPRARRGERDADAAAGR